ncbi:PRKR-interacting protein 1 [Paramyrothecium foliicola]|nr:PRKR-interacting protein 1 [Paramyrothecium foliicola]
MSGEGPESIPTSADPRSHRPTKKRALTPVSAQAASVDALFAKPDQDIRIPSSSGALARPNRAAPPEIVTNVQGSSAGAGSGEFHVYKASRRREYERLRDMDQDLRREKEQEQFSKEKIERDRRDEERTRKNREKREKLKARKAKGKGGAAAANGAVKPSTSAQSVDASREQPSTREDTADEVTRAEMSVSAQVPGIVIHDDD